MNCSNCNAEITLTDAKFCSTCGKPLNTATGPVGGSQKPATQISIAQDIATASPESHVTGLSVGQIRGEVNITGGHVVLHTSEETNLKLLDSISTEIKAQTAAGIAGAQLPQRMDEANEKLDTLLQLLRERDSAGRQLQGVSAANAYVTRVDLLLKKATLLKIKADQMMLDHVERGKSRVNVRSGQIDLNALMAGFDPRAHDAVLNEARALLDEARSLDPTNTEVLLHLAELLIQVTEDDPSDERRLLYEVQSLLRNPKDDTERFRLAQATFLLSTSHDPVDTDSLSDARAMFHALGRTDWTRHCDDLLESTGHFVQQQSFGNSWDGPAASGTTPRGNLPQPFSPIGSWNVQIMDAFGSTLQMSLRPDGSFTANQNVPLTGANLPAEGQWLFNPVNGFLQMHGMIAGFQPFALGIAVQGWQGNGYYGVGSDGIAYVLRRA